MFYLTVILINTNKNTIMRNFVILIVIVLLSNFLFSCTASKEFTLYVNENTYVNVDKTPTKKGVFVNGEYIRNKYFTVKTDTVNIAAPEYFKIKIK